MIGVALKVFDPLAWPYWLRRAMLLTLPIGFALWVVACLAALLVGFVALWCDIFRTLWKR